MLRNMLKLEKPYKLLKDEWQHVSTVLKPYALLYGGKKAWNKGDDATRKLKNRISTYTLLMQKGRCAYCEDLISHGAQLDHIAPKAKYPQYCYEPKNLVTTCPSCNMYLKNDDDTIMGNCSSRYNHNIFSIVHPYINNPDIHIKFTNEDRVCIDEANCTALGLNTIRKLHLNDYPSYCKRAILFDNGRRYPVDYQRYARECSSYK